MNQYELEATKRIVPIKLVNPEWRKITESHFNSFMQPPTRGGSAPLKKVFGFWDNERFLFDEDTAIPLITKSVSNQAEGIARGVLNYPSEAQFYEENKDIDNINDLIAKAIPVVAEIFYYEDQLDKLGFGGNINLWLCCGRLTGEKVEQLAQSIDKYDVYVLKNKAEKLPRSSKGKH